MRESKKIFYWSEFCPSTTALYVILLPFGYRYCVKSSQDYGRRSFDRRLPEQILVILVRDFWKPGLVLAAFITAAF